MYIVLYFPSEWLCVCRHIWPNGRPAGAEVTSWISSFRLGCIISSSGVIRGMRPCVLHCSPHFLLGQCLQSDPSFCHFKEEWRLQAKPSMCVTVYFCFQPAHTDFTPLLRSALITECDVDPVKYLSCAPRQWHGRKCLVTLFVSGLGK